MNIARFAYLQPRQLCRPLQPDGHTAPWRLPYRFPSGGVSLSSRLSAPQARARAAPQDGLASTSETRSSRCRIISPSGRRGAACYQSYREVSGPREVHPTTYPAFHLDSPEFGLSRKGTRDRAQDHPQNPALLPGMMTWAANSYSWGKRPEYAGNTRSRGQGCRRKSE
jgi:hypothetical protein